MDVEDAADIAASDIAAAIGDPARARILYSLMDGHARTSTELSVVADVSPSTASGHLNRLKSARLVNVVVQGKHRYYNLAGLGVAEVLEGLVVLAGERRSAFIPRTPSRLRNARTCYDHLAGSVGVAIHDRFEELAWIVIEPAEKGGVYGVTSEGEAGFRALGIDMGATRRQRRRFACGCLDWSERRAHLAGAMGAALLEAALRQKWLRQELDCRAITVTSHGRSQFRRYLGIEF